MEGFYLIFWLRNYPHATGTRPAGEEIMRRLTPLSGLQEDILQRQGLGTSLYGQLEIQEIGN